MAKIDGNIFGGFRGKLGNVVGYTWKGLWCVRSKPEVVRNPRSAAQQQHRTLFAEEVRLAGRMSWALNIGMATVANELHMTPQNVFVKANQQAFSPAAQTPPCPPQGGTTGSVCSPQGGTADAVSGSSVPPRGGLGGVTEALTVDWSALIVSAGPVAPIALGTPELSDDGVLTVAFEKNPCLIRANNFDQVHLYVYCPAQNTGYLAAPVYRKERRISLSLPDNMIGQELHLYAFVTDADGRASDTAYAALTTEAEADDTTDVQDFADTIESETTAIPDVQTLADSLETTETPPPYTAGQLDLFSGGL